MRGAVDRRVLAVVSREVIARRYCSAPAGRGRGRGAPAPAAPAAPGTPAAGASVGRGQAPPPASASVVKAVGRGISAAGRGAGSNVAKVEPAKPAASASSNKSQAAVGKPAAQQKGATERTVSEVQQNAQPQETMTQAGTRPPTSSEASELFAALVQSCVRSGLAAEVDYLYRGMQAAHVPISLQTCQTLLEIYIQLGNVQRMDSIYSEMREVRSGVEKLAPSPQEKTEASEIMAAMINSWHGRGLLQQVDLAYRAMNAAQLPAGVHTYRVLIDTYSRLGQYEAMDAVYTEMRKSLPSASPVQTATPQAPVTAAPAHQAPVQEQHPGQPYAPQYPTAYLHQAYPPHAMYQQWPYQAVPGYPYAAYGVQPAYYHPPQFTYPQVGVQPPRPVYAPQVPPYPGQAYPTAAMAPRPVTPAVTPPAPSVVTAPPAAQVAPAAHPPRSQASAVVHPDGATQATLKPAAPKRGGFELQPKALELLKQSEYNELLKQGRGHPAAAVSEAQAVAQAPAVAAAVHVPYPPMYGGQVAVPYVHYPPTGYYAPPLVAPIPGVPPPQVQPRPVVQPPVPRPVLPPTPAVRSQPVAPPQPVVPAAISQPVVAPATELEKVEVPKQAPAAQKEVKAEPSKAKQEKAEPVKTKQAMKAELKPAAKKVEPTKAATPTKTEATPKPEVKPADAKLKPDEKLKVQLKQEVAKAAEATVAREQEVAKESAETAAATDMKTPPDSPKSPSLKLDLKKKSEQAAPESPKSPSLKLDLAKRAPKAADPETEPPSPSLKLGLDKKAEQVATAAGERDADQLPKSPKLKLGLEKQKPSSPQAMEAPQVTEERSKEPGLPSIKKMLARGRGKALGVDPAATLLGVHAPSETLLRPTEDQEEQEEQEDGTTAILPALPFESRLAGRGRGKAIAAADPEAEAAKKRRLEEAAARALSILESAAGKAQLAANLERRKKRFSEQSSFGAFPRRGGETRIQVVSTRKPKAKRVATLEELKDDPINYVAPEEFMTKGETLTEFEEAVKGAVHRHFMLDLDPEAAMEEFGTNPDIDDKPVPTVEETLEQSKSQIMAQDGLNEDQWQEAMEDVKKRAPHIELLVRAYAGPKKKNAKQKNKELHDIVSKLPPYARPELADFAKRAARTLQGNPEWNHHAKVQVLNRVVRDASKF